MFTLWQGLVSSTCLVHTIRRDLILIGYLRKQTVDSRIHVDFVVSYLHGAALSHHWLQQKPKRRKLQNVKGI